MTKLEISFTDKQEGNDCVSVDMVKFNDCNATANEHKAADKLGAVIHLILKQDRIKDIYDYLKEQQSPTK